MIVMGHSACVDTESHHLAATPPLVCSALRSLWSIAPSHCAAWSWLRHQSSPVVNTLRSQSQIALQGHLEAHQYRVHSTILLYYLFWVVSSLLWKCSTRYIRMILYFDL
jgi:hypothetical protein